MKSNRAAQVMAVFNNLAIGLFSYLGRKNAAEALRYFAARIKQALSFVLCCLADFVTALRLLFQINIIKQLSEETVCTVDSLIAR
jgi:hypothetical protein